MKIIYLSGCIFSDGFGDLIHIMSTRETLNKSFSEQVHFVYEFQRVITARPHKEKSRLMVLMKNLYDYEVISCVLHKKDLHNDKGSALNQINNLCPSRLHIFSDQLILHDFSTFTAHRAESPQFCLLMKKHCHAYNKLLAV